DNGEDDKYAGYGKQNLLAGFEGLWIGRHGAALFRMKPTLQERDQSAAIQAAQKRLAVNKYCQPLW
ncbi:MAG: hypothetical protein Q9M12_06270, partial [Mariprofundus sp.]|nr:hypothetical protein [Mariprofundus sp.]